MHTQKSLEADLERAGIRPSDTLLVHSSMKKIGQVDGGADAVIDAFLDYFRDNGLIVFPTLTFTIFHEFNPETEKCQNCMKWSKPEYCLAKPWVGKKPEFHANTTPACIGLLPNLFRVRPGVVRSLNPTHSLAAAGKDARDFTAGHEKGTTPCGKHTPWWKLYLRGAKILHLGSRVSNTTYMHGVDEWNRTEENPQPFLAQQVDVYDENERLVPMAPQRNTSGSSGRFPMLEDAFERIGGLSRHKIGDADAILLDCRKVADCTLDALAINPNLFGFQREI